jgi:pimeloyl-ACP methyl ester carboxylesterase
MRQLHREGVVLAFEETGTGAPPIVLVHDLGSDHTCFASQLERFSSQHRVVAVDLRGHGQSGRSPRDCTVAVLADDLVWLGLELGLDRPVVLGQGLGGLVALDLAARYPEIPAAVVLVPVAAGEATTGTQTPLTHPGQVAGPLLEIIADWVQATPDAGWSIPEVCVALGFGEAARDAASLPRPGVAGHVASGARQRLERTLPDEISPLVDELLAMHADRAPPRRQSPFGGRWSRTDSGRGRGRDVARRSGQGSASS